MTDPHDTPPPRRSTSRDADVRAVSRVTWGIAAVAIAGTVTVGALAAGGVSSQSGAATPAASDGVAPLAQDAYVAPDPARYDDDDSRGEDDDYRDDGAAQPSGNLQPPQSAPTQTFQPPAVSSGGS